MEALITELAQNSLLALLLAISLFALYFLFKKYTEEVRFNDELQEKRITDYKDTQNTVMKVLEKVDTNTTTTLQTILSGRKK